MVLVMVLPLVRINVAGDRKRFSRHDLNRIELERERGVSRAYPVVVLGLFGLAILAATRFPLHAQGEGRAEARPKDPASVNPFIQASLLRPYHFQFGEPTPLEQVASRLSKDLGSPVVLDVAALARQGIVPEAGVKLELQGVRLATGLKLLLDQVGLTYRTVPEDNLLIVTDREGAEDPMERLAAEVNELHRDVHDIQDAIDELREAMGLQESEPRVRKPTIIEELPDGASDLPGEGDQPRSVPRLEPELKPQPSQPSRPRAGL